MTGRYAKVTYRNGDSRQSFVGHWSVRADGYLVGERKEAVSDEPNDGGFDLILHLAIVGVDDVVSVWREDPKYGTWTRSSVEWLRGGDDA